MSAESAPRSLVQQGAIGELFHATPDAVLIFRDGALVEANDAAARLLGCPPEQIARRPELAALLGVAAEATLARVELSPFCVVDVLRRRIGDHDALILRDVSLAVRQERGLRHIAEVSRALIGEPRAVAAVLQSLVTEAKQLTGAAYSALLLLRPGSTTETSHFVYDAPRHLFPTQMPRVVGLLSVPVASKCPARLDDIRGHAAGVGLPGVHPPIGPLVAVPILAGDEVMGELAVANAPDGRAFDEVDEQLLQDLAAHVAVAVRWSQQAERIREQELLRQEVVDTARHDIRTPLGAGKGYALLLARKLDRMSPEQIAGAIEGLTSSFDRIESFSERLLVDQRRELVGVEPQWEQIDLVALLASLRRDAASANGREAVVVDHQLGAPGALAGDPEMVREVLDNLVSNALKHGPGDRPIVVSARSEGDHVRIDVRDEGHGIAEADQAALFERWSRTDSSRSRQVPGFGLGLSIVKRLVTAHGGTLGVSSRPDEGATFWVTFPLQVPA